MSLRKSRLANRPSTAPSVPSCRKKLSQNGPFLDPFGGGCGSGCAGRALNVSMKWITTTKESVENGMSLKCKESSSSGQDYRLRIRREKGPNYEGLSFYFYSYHVHWRGDNWSPIYCFLGLFYLETCPLRVLLASFLLPRNAHHSHPSHFKTVSTGTR
uniref:Uncharacterized protein n=1 Tax=Pseudictyota dubia TaxID=2749911 RepID=A0A7R9VBX6_9STRA